MTNYDDVLSLINELQNPHLRELAEKAEHEFDLLGDYIWKSPRFIYQEKHLEIKKLDDYFPIIGNNKEDKESILCRTMRWTMESKKIFDSFPIFMANGNLFSSASLFESHCLTLVKALESKTGRPLTDIRGSGIMRLLNYLSTVGVEVDQIPLVRQVRICIKVRNCLFHANGLLAISKDETEIRKIVKKGQFLSEDRLIRRIRLNLPIDEVVINKSNLGDRLNITNMYSYIANSYFRNYFFGLCRNSLHVMDS